MEQHIKIYVIAHKPVKLALNKGYALMQVNAQANPVFSVLNDATGDNISLKNPNFCELTGLYWIWKNDKTDTIVGLVHYRRFFSKCLCHSPKFFLNEEDILKRLKTHDVIATRPHFMFKSVYKQTLQCCKKKDLDLLRATIDRLSPDYLSDYDYVMGHVYSRMLNMLIAPKKIVDSYASWLFMILFEVEKHLDMSGYTPYQKRVFGFMGERLLTVYLLHNHLTVFSQHVAKLK